MAGHRHEYRVTVTWQGNRGTGTSGYRDYGREHVIACDSKPDIAGSADPAFRGDAERWNPEDLLLASVAACHKLWYLHFCAVNGVIVTEYEDHADGVMVTGEDGAGRFTEIMLRPRVLIAAGDAELAEKLHHDAHDKCFIANSVNFPVRYEPVIVAG